MLFALPSHRHVSNRQKHDCRTTVFQEGKSGRRGLDQHKTRRPAQSEKSGGAHQDSLTSHASAVEYWTLLPILLKDLVTNSKNLPV